MVLDIAQYTATDSAALLQARPAMIAALRKRFPGFVGERLARTAGGDWVDIVAWSSMDHARAAVAGEPSLEAYVAFARHIGTVRWSDCLELSGSDRRGER